MKLQAVISLIFCLAGEASIASWYGWEHQGKIMANGRPFDCRKLTCASWNFPMGTRLMVSCGNRSVEVTVTDRGPAPRLRRDIDLSLAAFRRLAHPDRGLASVHIRRVR